MFAVLCSDSLRRLSVALEAFAEDLHGRRLRQDRRLRLFNSVGIIFGPCGKPVYHNARVVAWDQYAPATCFPKARTYHAHPSEDAYLISCLAVAPEYRQRRIGETLLRAGVDDLRLRAVETFARRGSPNNPSGPIELYLKHGFKVKTDDEFLPEWTFNKPRLGTAQS